MGFQKGNTIWLGRKRTPENIEKMRQANLGKKLSEETKQKISAIKKGFKHTEETKKKISETHKGEKNNMWKGGKRKSMGYIWLLLPEHPHANSMGYYAEHRYLMEQEIGRYLLPEESVHHINNIRNDNRIENLLLCASESEHQKLHIEKKFWLNSPNFKRGEVICSQA